MSTLKGQNLRIYTRVDSGLKVVGMATNCTITLVNNVSDESTKDDTGLAQKPITQSKSWSVQVESLNVTDAATMLAAIKSMTPFNLVWDESGTTDNKAHQEADFARCGSAYLTDLNLTFNDRTTSAKTLQFTGTGAVSTITDMDLSDETVPAGSYTKGQFVRLFLSSDNTATPASVIGGARELTLHISVSVENSTTKDTEGEWENQEPTSLSYDITTNALVRSGDTITSLVTAKGLDDLEKIHKNGTPVKWNIANVSGDNQRTKGVVIASGSAVLTNLEIQAQNKTGAQYRATLNGYGDYTVSA